jgi:hypothetical protein
MRRHTVARVAVVGLLAAASVAWAQATGVMARQGFNVTTLIAELSLYLPEEATQGMYGNGGRAGGQGQQAQGSGSQGQGTGSQAAGGQRQRFQINFTRDVKLFLTRDQITKILPILTGLKDNPMPTPSKARQVQADVDAILTAAQKAEYVEFQKQVEKLIQSYRQQMGASGGAAGGGAGGSGGQQDQGAQAGQGGRTGQGGGQQPTQLQRRQRQVETFIKVLQDRQKQLGA